MLFSPGPVEVEEGVLEAQAKPLIHHRSKEMTALYGGLCEWFASTLDFEECYILASSGTGALECAAANLSNRALVLSNGVFGRKLHAIARLFSKSVEFVEIEEGKGLSLECVEGALIKSNADTLFMVHNETSVGVLNHAEQICARAQELGMLTIVDSISGWPGAARPKHADVLITSSQKALGVPPGLGIIMLSSEAVKRYEAQQSKSYYFDLKRFKEFYKRSKQPPSTPAVSLLYALKRAVERLEAVGLEKYHEMHAKAGERVRAFLSHHALTLLAEKGFESPTLSAFFHPSPQKLIEEMGAKGYFLVPAKGKYAEKAVRIGHMGFKQLERLDDLLEALEGVV